MNTFRLPHRSIKSAVQTSSLTAGIGLIGGVALQSVKEELFLVVPLLIALPALNAMAGDYSTLINAHVADPESTRANKIKLLKSLIISVPLSAIGVVLVSLYLAGTQGFVIDRTFVLTFTLFIFGAFAIIVSATLISGLVLNRIFARLLINSDDALIPISNVLASVLMLLCVSLAAWRLF